MSQEATHFSSPIEDGKSKRHDKLSSQDQADTFSPPDGKTTSAINNSENEAACYHDDEHAPLLSQEAPKTYARRWYILFLFCMVTMIQGLGWGTFGPITQSCKAVFGWSNSTIAHMALGSNICLIICCFPFSYVMEKKGMRLSMISSMLFLAAGFGMQCVSMETPTATWTITIGQILIGGGAVVPMSGVTMLSSLWFPLRQRTTATSLATVFGFCGNSLAFILGPLVVPEYSEEVNNSTNGSLPQNSTPRGESADTIHEQREAIRKLLYGQAGASAVILILLLVYFPDKPPTPPTMSAKVDRLDVLKGLRSLTRNVQYILVLVAFSIGTGVYASFGIMLDIDVHPLGVSQKTAGWIGFYTTVGGCTMAFAVARLSDMFLRRLKTILLLLLIPTIVTLVWFCLLVAKYIPYDEVSLYFAAIISGVCIYGSWSLYFELACEASYPTGEGITTLTMILINVIIGCFFLGVLSIPDIGVVWMNYLLLASFTLVFIIIIMTKVPYRRTNLDMQETVSPPSSGDDVTYVAKAFKGQQVNTGPSDESSDCVYRVSSKERLQ